MEIDHFLHHHPLKLICEEMHGYKLRCHVCTEYISSETYSCNDCRFSLHKSCAELPREIHLFFHLCPFFLGPIPPQFDVITCYACKNVRIVNAAGCVYKCERCRLYMDVGCALNPPTINSADQQIEHFTHFHPLTLVPEKEAEEEECPVCQNLCSGPIYGCSKCKFHIHKYCMDILPRMVQHLFHPCPLNLIASLSTGNFCSSCRKPCKHLYYSCSPCLFYLDVKCALLPTTKTDHYKKIRANWHEHPLTHFEEVVTSTSCRACKKKCLGPTYGCNTCSFFLHKYCYELPQHIQSRFDLEHPLCLTNFTSPNIKNQRPCSLCFKDCNGIAFSCRYCSTQLHIECASLAPTIKYQGHSHVIYFVEKVTGEPICNSCGWKILTEFPALRCGGCNFNLHLLCGRPLPITIKHRRHLDPLKLKNFYIEEDCDEDDFYCDVCENRRDPRQPVYYCPQGCPFVSEVNCVISEVAASLKGERGNVKLRSVFGLLQDDKANGFVVDNIDLGYDAKEEKLDAEFCTIKPTPFELDDSGIDELKCLREAVERKMKRGRATSPQVKQEEYKYIPSLEFDFTQFQNGIDSLASDKLNLYYKDLQGYFTGGRYMSYKILNIDLTSAYDPMLGEKIKFPHILLPIYESLLPKYGDITAGSKLSPNVKVILFMVLCMVILDMNGTAVVDISKYRLVNWMALLKLVECGGFKVDFIWNRLQRVTRACFGLDTIRLAQDTLAKQQEEIAEISREVDELTKRLEAKKREHEDYKLFIHSAATNSYVRQCLDEASTIKWKPASDDLFN